MICPKCKAEITDGSKFCIKCGARIQDAPQQTNTDKPAEAENAKVPEKPADTDTAKAPEKPADAPAAPAPEKPAPSVPAPEKPAESAKAAGVVCLRCGHAVKDGMKFCTKCGSVPPFARHLRKLLGSRCGSREGNRKRDQPRR